MRLAIEAVAEGRADSVVSAGNTGAGTFRIFGELTYKEPGALAQTLLDVELIDPSVGFSGNGSFGAEQK